MQWYEINQSEFVRERLQEAEEHRLAEEAKRFARAERAAHPRPERDASGRPSIGAALGGLVARFAGR